MRLTLNYSLTKSKFLRQMENLGVSDDEDGVPFGGSDNENDTKPQS